MRAILLACALSTGLLAGAHAQAPGDSQPEPSGDPPTFRTGVSSVRVDVTVTGRDDRPVADLTPEDFEIREDGVLQQVETLQFIRLTGFPRPDSDESLAIRSPEHAAQEAARDDVRLLVIFIDDYHLSYGAFADHQLRQTLRRFVLSEMRPLDLFAVMSPLTPMSHLHFTRDRQEILGAIDRVQGQRGGFVTPRSLLEENQLSLGGRQRVLVRAQVSLSALESLAVHLSGLREGRKSVLFVSEGPPLVSDSMPLWDRLEDVITAANTGNVTIHTLDPRDLGSAPFTNGANEALAGETGGRRLAHSNDYTRALRAVMADASAYYLLGYTPAREAGDGRFHRIEVRVRRKGVRVLARKGYWAPSTEEMQPRFTRRTPPEIAGVLDALELSARPQLVTDWIGLGPVEGGRRQVTLMCAPGAAANAAAIGAIAVDVLDGHEALVASHETTASDGVWLARFEAGPEARSVRISVLDDEGAELDAWVRALDLPDAGALSHVGTPVVFRPKTTAAWRALLDGADLLPAIDRHFRRTDRMVVRLPLGAAAAGSEVRAELVNNRGETLLALPVTRGERLPDPLVDVPLAALAQSSYVLRLSAVANGTRTDRLVPFAIVP